MHTTPLHTHPYYSLLRRYLQSFIPRPPATAGGAASQALDSSAAGPGEEVPCANVTGERGVVWEEWSAPTETRLVGNYQIGGELVSSVAGVAGCTLL